MTRALTRAMASAWPAVPMAASTVSMQSATSFMLDSTRPRVVTAGVPRRMPEAWKGLRVSNGTVFLLQVIDHIQSQSKFFYFFRVEVNLVRKYPDFIGNILYFDKAFIDSLCKW